MTIRLAGVEKRYEKRARRPALSQLDISLGSENTIVLGPNGAGKSTLFRVVLGLERPTSGTSAGKEARRIGSGTRPELPALPAGSRLSELLRVVDPSGRRSAECVSLFGLQEIADRRVERLSKGERQRASLAMAFSAGAPFSFSTSRSRASIRSHGLSCARESCAPCVFFRRRFSSRPPTAPRRSLLRSRGSSSSAKEEWCRTFRSSASASSRTRS